MAYEKEIGKDPLLDDIVRAFKAGEMPGRGDLPPVLKLVEEVRYLDAVERRRYLAERLDLPRIRIPVRRAPQETAA